MRKILLVLAGTLLAAPLQAQNQTKAVFELTREVESSPERVEQEAETVAESKRYLREAATVGDPTVLIPGDLYLDIADTPFIFYLQSTNHHTQVSLESMKLDVSEEATREAKAFLKEVSSRATGRSG